MGEKAVLKTGLAFSSAIFIIYLVMGLGLLRGLTYIPQIKYIIFLITFILGTLHILAFLGKNVRRIPKIFEIWIFSRLKQAVNPKTAFVAGIITAFLLLPCTSGPYILILNLLSKNISFFEGLILLLIYHAIITSPFIIVTVCIHTLTITTTRLKRWSSTYQKWISLFSGVTMLLLSLFLLLF
jgi:cytochrome c biogenesis protein CcdA